MFRACKVSFVDLVDQAIVYPGFPEVCADGDAVEAEDGCAPHADEAQQLPSGSSFRQNAHLVYLCFC